ncbi:hypothetical protein TWF281_002182 [Arthrobotrys megalospora]
MSDPKNYTVGWICAVGIEYFAAKALLDEVHAPMHRRFENDITVFTMGRIGNHNVVIGTLPFAEYGIIAAANVARSMLRHFVNVRVSLIVGIGGGAPSRKNDIRLGDLVIGTPQNGNSGVLGYASGEDAQGQAFQQMGYLNPPPPPLLQKAVGDLKAKYEREGHHIHQRIDTILQNHPNLREAHARPNLATDLLYRSDYIHPPDPQNKIDCTVACGNHPSNLVSRHPRSANEESPKIHYGLIASAGKLVKNSKFRDEFAEKHDVLCFGMEDVGLMNHFPCLVIRGICDYSDSHKKKKKWQGYAAMVAAVYAKDILSEIAPASVLGQARINDVVSGERIPLSS